MRTFNVKSTTAISQHLLLGLTIIKSGVFILLLLFFLLLWSYRFQTKDPTCIQYKQTCKFFEAFPLLRVTFLGAENKSEKLFNAFFQVTPFFFQLQRVLFAQHEAQSCSFFHCPCRLTLQVFFIQVVSVTIVRLLRFVISTLSVNDPPLALVLGPPWITRDFTWFSLIRCNFRSFFNFLLSFSSNRRFFVVRLALIDGLTGRRSSWP